MKEIQVIKNLAKEVVENYGFNKDNWESFIEDTDSVNDLGEHLEKIKNYLLNYEEYYQDYLNGLIDEIDNIVKNK